MAKTDEKIVRDAVHGYIHIDSEYCKIIDTPNFQRLKRLEQTNVRPLYPCAHHDRFIHSLGVFHLGKTAFNFLKENSIKDNSIHDRKLPWEDAKLNFELACLLHDVGHSPFSHTFEMYYDSKDNKKLNNLLINNENLKCEGREEEKKRFIDDYKNYIKELPKEKKNSRPAQHEKVSAFLVLSEYYEILSNIKEPIDPFLIARMILGLKYEKREKEKLLKERLAFYNCFISLLNSETIDVDKLDYYARDQWATGNISKTIDFERLFSSMYLRQNNERDKVKEGQYVICFHKRAVDDIMAMIETKKMIAASMHSHHIVKYDEYVLIRAIKDVAKRATGKEEDEAMREIINISALNKSCTYEVGKDIKFKLHLLTDDDLIYLLKYYINESHFAKEWFERSYELKAVWKTYADYKFFFGYDKEKTILLLKNIRKIVEEYLEIKKTKKLELPYPETSNNYYYVEPSEKEYAPILAPKIKIYIKEQVRDLSELRDTKYSENNEEKSRYFLLYLPKRIVEQEELRNEFVQFVKDAVDEISEPIQNQDELTADDLLCIAEKIEEKIKVNK